MFEGFFLALQDNILVFLFFLVLLTEAGLPIPIPSDALILTAGYRQLPLPSVIVAVVLGNLIGSSILYRLSWRFGGGLEDKAIKFFRIPSRQREIAESWFRRWGKFAIIVARIIPGVRFATTFLAGSLKLPYKKVFLPYLSIGSLLWAVIYWSIGAIVGENIQIIFHFIHTWIAVFLLVSLGTFLYIWYKYIIKRKND
jgi:membrane protein DedA with SNARE-associated domain